MGKLTSKLIKEFIVKTCVINNNELISKEINGLTFLDIDIKELMKSIKKQNNWKRIHKCKILNKVRRIMAFNEGCVYIPPEYIGNAVISSAVINLIQFNIVFEIMSDEKDENVLEYKLLYIGEHDWEENFCTSFIL